MALPTRPATSWTRSLDLPSTLFESGSDDYELYEDDEESVLTVEMPGFDAEDIDVNWDDGVHANEVSVGSAGVPREPAGVLNVAAEHHDDHRSRQKTCHRRFRFPRRTDEDAIEAEYRNGVLEIRLSVETGAPVRGTEIDVQG